VVRRDAKLIVDRPWTIRAETYAFLVSSRSRRGGAVLRQKGGCGPAAAWAAWAKLWYDVGTWLDNSSGGALSDAGADVIEDVVDGVKEIWNWITD
jgi:hypothetical protein